jgi:hypothetical protein
MQSVYRTVTILCLGSAFSATAARATQPREKPLAEAAGPVIEYPSVAAALLGLHARRDVVFTMENGWTIATDEVRYTIWSFAPSDYPAYPAVVKRQVIPQGTGSSIEMSVQCEASKAACDDLVRIFSKMNGLELPK